MDAARDSRHGAGGGVAELTLRERSVKGHRGPRLQPLDVPAEGAERFLPRERLRGEAPGLPEISEPAVVRHFVNLSVLNHHIDKAIYPLGSCTMKWLNCRDFRRSIRSSPRTSRRGLWR